MLASALCITAWGRVRVQALLTLLSTVATLVCAVLLLDRVRSDGVQVVAMGGWAAPYGIALVADLFSSVMLVLGSIVGVAVALFSMGMTDARRAAKGHYPLVLSLLAAVSGAFVSGDLFNLYVWFELMLLSSFVLLTLGGERAQLEGAIKYVALNLLSSVLFLSTVGLIYAVTGTLNMAHLAVRLDELGDPELATALGAPLLVAFGIKAAVFPVFFWLPASYHTPPAAVSALFAGLLTKVGVYSIIRATLLMFDQEWSVLGDAVLLVAGLTMVSGVLGAVAQNDMRRILSFHIVSQIGYMLMGLGVAMSVLSAEGLSADDPLAVGAGLALSGSVFYIMHHIIVKTNLFLISGAVMRARGTSDLKRLGGLVQTHPGLAGLFLVSALSLAGIPVLSGFWAKLSLVRGGLQAEAWWIVAVSLAVSLLTLLSMTKIWSEAFWKAVPEGVAAEDARRGIGLWVTAPIVCLAALTVAIGLGASWAFDLARLTAEQLLDSSVYIEAVLPDAALEVAP
ncbi:MAG: proton-conducting transporter transmembrane domain-containing protein [Phycisphaerales bacterium]